MNSKERTQEKINELLVYLLIRSQIQLHVHSLYVVLGRFSSMEEMTIGKKSEDEV